MRPILAIAKRELGAFFKSPVAYIVLAFYAAMVGFLFFKDFFVIGLASMESFFDNLPFILLFLAPALSMRLIAEERGQGTIELLLTLPVRDSQVIVGKYLAALGVLLVGVLLTVPFAFTVANLGPLDWGPVITGHIGTLLLGGTYLAIGLFASTLTKNQIVAFIVGWVICLFLFLTGSFLGSAGSFGPILMYASPQYHFQRIARGVVELKNLVYFVSIIGAFLVLSIQVMESRKWR